VVKVKSLLIVLLVFSFLSLSFMTLKDLKDADELYERINALSYKEFARAPGWGERSRATIPHQEGQEIYVDIYINDVILEALEANEPLEEWPVGSLLVKDTYVNGEYTSVGANEKRKDGWVIMQWNADGVAEFAGKPKVCWNCHKIGDDMVRAFRFPQYQDSK